MSKVDKKTYLQPDWPAPKNIKSLVTQRKNTNAKNAKGYSKEEFSYFNLAQHVEDDFNRVELNRKDLQSDIGLQAPLHWINQVHGSRVSTLTSIENSARDNASLPDADALYTNLPNTACGVLTADCLAVFFCDLKGQEVAVAHAGWRGLAGGVLENTLSAFQAEPAEILAWLGPAIGPCHFEVGKEVLESFIKSSHESLGTKIEAAFQPSLSPNKWQADIFQLARIRLQAVGITKIYGGGLCTFCDDKRFYSYRRQAKTGRFASIIWKDS